MAMPAAVRKLWTLEDLDRLPEDGNTYELLHGELFVSPGPGPRHELILARLSRLLDRYVAAQDLGHVWRPRSVVQRKDTQLEPDLFVAAEFSGRDWKRAPRPVLVVEVLSPTSWRRDLELKRGFYVDEERFPEYWVVDPDERSIRVFRPDGYAVTHEDVVTWQPASATTPFSLSIAELFA